MPFHSSALAREPEGFQFRYTFAPENDPEDGAGEPVSHEFGSSENEDLPYKVELWDSARNSVEQVLAVTANASIGYAAFYAATREHPDRYVTLRHKNSIVSRWNSPAN